MDLLELNDMKGVPSPPLSHIEPFNEIIDRDTSDNKTEASKELAYIHFMVHYESPYLSWSKDIRPEKIIKDIWGDLEWEPDELVNKGVEKYREITASPYTRLLDSAWEQANTLIKHFEENNIEDAKEAKDAINNLSKIGSVVEGIEKLTEQVKKHKSKQNANRAGAEVNKYSEGD